MSNSTWSLEVVRGREVGRVYPLSAGETVLGNALNGSAGLDLGPQEGEGPRRMAARQASIQYSAKELIVRDLESPGGTFVNRQRLLVGQARALAEGDVIQVGGIQLKVVTGGPPPKTVRPAPPPPPARPSPLPTPSAPARATSAKPGALATPFVLASGAICRSWDDFLTVSAQRWSSMRDELVSGRLAAFMNTVGRAEMAPSPNAPGTPDERLDAWLGTLPTTRPSAPELEVHPGKLILRATPGGEMRQVVQVTNIGYRLLRSTVKVDPGSSSWIEVGPEVAKAPFFTVERSEIPLRIRIPDSFGTALSGAIVVESNGGIKRVEIRVERAVAADAIPDAPSAGPAVSGRDLFDLIARQSLPLRLGLWTLSALLFRWLVMLGSLVPLGGAAAAGGARLAGVAVLFAAVGSLAAALLASRRGEARDVPPAAFAGGFAGVLCATIAVAICRTVERGAVVNPVLQSIIWAALGAVLAAVSVVVVPPRDAKESAP